MDICRRMTEKMEENPYLLSLHNLIFLSLLIQLSFLLLGQGRQLFLASLGVSLPSQSADPWCGISCEGMSPSHLH